MQGVAISKIPGVLVEKHQVYGNENVRTKARKENRNRLIDQIGQVKIGLKRERLAKIRKKVEEEFGPENYELRGDNGDYTPNKDEKFLMHDMLTGLLDEYDNAILQALPDLLTVVTDSFTEEGKCDN